MFTEKQLKDITTTIEGYPVRNLKWNQIDNIIVGQVKDPIIGKPSFLDGYITVQWRKNGKPTNTYKGREDLQIKINYGD